MRGIAGMSCVLLAALALVAASVPVSALDRSEGDFWTFEMSMDMDVVEVDGTIKITVEDTREITVDGHTYEVNVMVINGEMSGSAEILTISVDYEVLIDGVMYEEVGGLSTVKDEMTMDMTMEVSMMGLSFSTTMVQETVTTYSPPEMYGFDPETTLLGSSWTETCWTNTTTSTWENGTWAGEDESESEVTYDIGIASTMQTVTVPAGTFETMKITISNDDDLGSTVYYWSEEVGYFVKEENYESGSLTPFTTMVLTDYGKGDAGGLMVLLIVAVVVVVVAVVVLAVLLMKRRRAPPMPVQPGVPPPVAPPPPPPGS